MKRIISGFCAFCIFFSAANAFVTYEIPVREEEIIAINFISESDEILENIDLSKYKDAKIVDYKMEKGKANFEIKNNKVILDLYDGKYFEGETIQEKTTTEKIDNLVLQKGKAIFTPEKEIKRVIDVNGDFESGDINGNEVVLELRKGAGGIKGYNKDKIVKSSCTIQVSKDNSSETVYSDFYIFNEEMPDNAKIKIKDVNLEGNATLDISDNKIRLLFTNGIPNLEESTRTDGYGYYWIDRALDGTFRDKYPNSVYRTDRFYFEGRGAHINDERLIIEREFEDNWKDYVGFVLGEQKYIYLLSDISENLFKDAVILKNRTNNFKAKSFPTEYKLNWMNTEEMKVEITDSSVRYIPEGILYSMGELVAYAEDWGETVPNRSDESAESFFNVISGRMETYVKHFKFFYGPKQKQTFGGTVTYPYKATVEYEHYEPVNLYNGSITYTYEEIVDDAGYEFSGWLKISYTGKKTINDYPPTPPYNVSYNKLTKELSWHPATDDYTKSEDMGYEIEVEAGDSFYKIGETKNGETKIQYKNVGKNKFRVRAIDSQNQFSEWVYSDKNSIRITGNVEPQEVLSGSKIDISATVKSLENIKSVQAYSEKLNIGEELIKKSEKIPKAVEVSFNLLNHIGQKPWLIVEDMNYAIIDHNKTKIKSYPSDAETQSYTIDVEIPGDISFSESGTIILANQNYTETPINVTVFDEKTWYFYSMCSLNFKNKNTGKKETFIQFANDKKEFWVGRHENIEITPYIKVNLFDYSNGDAKYQEIPVEADVATKPIAVSWCTKEENVEIIIYIDGEYFYKYQVSKDNLFNNVENFESYTLSKKMKRLSQNSAGYTYHYSGEMYSWANMYTSSNILNIPWLGYKIKSKIENPIYQQYNNLSTTRDVNRIVFIEENISEYAINLYLSKIKSTNMLINKKNVETVFGDDAQEITSEYVKNNIEIAEDIEPGTYEIVLIATDQKGEIARCVIPLIVKEKEDISIKKEDIKIGRFYYDNNNIDEKCVEELSLTKFNLDTKGFISAGETLAIVIDEDVESITIDFAGDKSIKEYDALTQRFLGENRSYDFPLVLYPNEKGVFLYTIPYKTEQTLESWATLRDKSEDFENIDKEKLFSRILNPYELKVKINNEEFVFKMDVFERWDTILNRDASKYITNSKQKWRIRL